MVLPQGDGAEDFHFPDSYNYKATIYVPVELESKLKILAII